MPTPPPIDTPAGFAPAFALGFDDGAGALSLASSSAPLPVASIGTTTVTSQRPATPPALSGSTSASTTVGPFAPTPDIPVVLQLEGVWEGQVQMLRSHDGGVSQIPVTVAGLPWATYSSNVCEPVWSESEPGVELYFEVVLASGAIDYRVSQ